MIKGKAAWVTLKSTLFYIRKASFKPFSYHIHASSYIWLQDLKINKFLSVFFDPFFFLSRRLTNPDTHEFRQWESEERQRTMQETLLRSFYPECYSEPKGRDVSEGLIGSDTTEKLSGLLHVLSSVTSKTVPGYSDGRGRPRERDWLKHSAFASY